MINRQYSCSQKSEVFVSKGGKHIYIYIVKVQIHVLCLIYIWLTSFHFNPKDLILSTIIGKVCWFGKPKKAIYICICVNLATCFACNNLRFSYCLFGQISIYFSLEVIWLTYSGRNKMAAIVQTAFSNAFLAATKQLYEWFSPSVCLSVCLFVRPSHIFDYVPIIVSSWIFQELLPMTEVTSM